MKEEKIITTTPSAAPPPLRQRRGLSKHIFSVGAMTAISRVCGFIRDMLIARYLGAGRASDIFLAAFKLPNMFRDLLGEGALSSVFIPMFADKKKDPNFAQNVFSWLMLILLIITIIFQIFMPVVMWAFAPGFDADPGKLELTVTISRIMFFYVIFVCGSAFLAAILNAFSRFALAAFMPILLNVMLIGALVGAGVGVGAGALLYILSATVVLSGIIQMAILWGRIRRGHFGLRLIRPRWTADVKQIFKRLGVGIVGSGFYQINIVIGTLVASYQAGAVSWLYYADRIIQLPFAIVGLAAGTVMISSISNAIADKNMRSVYIQQNSVIRQSMMLIIPSMVGLIVLAEPLIRTLFEYGRWTADSTTAVAHAIMIGAVALPAMMMNQVYTKTLFAAQDVKTPVRSSMISLGAACAIYLGLFGVIGYLAIPIGTVASGYIRNLLMSRVCKRRGLIRMDARTIRATALFTILAVALGAVMWFVPVTNIWTLAATVAGFATVYLPSAWIITKKNQ